MSELYYGVKVNSIRSVGRAGGKSTGAAEAEGNETIGTWTSDYTAKATMTMAATVARAAVSVFWARRLTW